MTDKVFKIFIDFDGTITTADVGAGLVNTFGDKEKVAEIVKAWMENKITSPESWYAMFDTMKDFSSDKLESFLADYIIDETFPAFVNYCEENKFEIQILSDGFDFYINRLLERENLSHLKVFCNKSRFIDNKPVPSFPWSDEECKFCGNCKRNHILTNTGDEDYIVYIGDGYSDKCPIQFCDFVFAKQDLLRYCEMNRITYFPFNNFNDVTGKINELKGKKRIKKRHQAELKRKEIFMQG